MFSYEMAKKYANSEGVYVECGVAAGAQIIAMAVGAPDKTIYAFDSFQGIPLPSNMDAQMPGIRNLSLWEQKALPPPGKQALESSGATVVSEEDFMMHITKSGIGTNNIYPVKGWFEEVIPLYARDVIHNIAILRLDGDLYNSTYVCLKHLYPKVIKGGLVIVDDYKLLGCKQAVVDYRMEYEGCNCGITEWTRDGYTMAYWYKS